MVRQVLPLRSSCAGAGRPHGIEADE
jgi:hypothetical protein